MKPARATIGGRSPCCLCIPVEVLDFLFGCSGCRCRPQKEKLSDHGAD